MATAIEVQTAHGAGVVGHDDGGHADHPPTSTGLNSRKMLMWLFLTSDGPLMGRSDDQGQRPERSNSTSTPAHAEGSSPWLVSHSSQK